MSIPGDNSLSTFDVEMFDFFQIQPEERAGRVSRVTNEVARLDLDICWRDTTVDLAGLAYHYVDPLINRRVMSRVRLDHPPMDVTGKVIAKYLSPPNGRSRQHLWFPNGTASLLKDVTVPVVIVEAEKSSMAITSAAHRANRRLLVIACGGCMGWWGRVGKRLAWDGSNVDERGPLPDFYYLDWHKREVIVLFDTNAKDNVNVRRAQRRLAAFLTEQGARVRIGKLWLLQEGK
jgi:hypothetical protein